MKLRSGLWLMACICLYLSVCISSHPISTRFLIQSGKITSKRLVDDDLLLSNQDHYSVDSLNDKIHRSNSDNYLGLRKTNNSKSLGMSHLLELINSIIFFFSSSDPQILRKFEKNDYLLVRGEAYRLMTSIFLHADLPHITANNLSLSEIGPEVSSYHPFLFLQLMLFFKFF